jgi:hypothetical protein
MDRVVTTSVRPCSSSELLQRMDPELIAAVSEVDETLIRLALQRSPFERLRAGVAMARFASRFRRGSSESR